MTDRKVCYCASFRYALGQQIIATLSSVYGESTQSYKGLVQSKNRDCVLIVASPLPLEGSYFRVVEYRPKIPDYTCPINSAIRNLVKESVSIVCSARIRIVGIDEAIVAQDFSGFLRAFKVILNQVTEGQDDCSTPPGKDPLGYTFGIGGDIRDHTLLRFVQTSCGEDPEMM